MLERWLPYQPPHEKPTLHWTEHPLHFQQNIDRYAANEAIVFDGIHFLHVWAYLMSKRYDLLAKSYVNIGNRFKSDEEVISFLRQRTQRFWLAGDFKTYCFPGKFRSP